jgi:hypothetical protein
MRTKHIYNARGSTRLRTEWVVPVCGEDFCDKCGDCLACYGSDPCPEGKVDQHLWIEYADDE